MQQNRPESERHANRTARIRCKQGIAAGRARFHLFPGLRGGPHRARPLFHSSDTWQLVINTARPL